MMSIPKSKHVHHLEYIEYYDKRVSYLLSNTMSFAKNFMTQLAQPRLELADQG